MFLEVEITGRRPGEKLYEELWDEGADYAPTDHPEITRLNGEDLLAGDALAQTVDRLAKMAQAGDVEGVLKLLDESIPGAAIRSTPPPDITSLV